MATLFRDEKANDAPELQLKLQRLSRDFPKETKFIESDLIALAALAGMANTRLFVNSLLDSIESQAGVPR